MRPDDPHHITISTAAEFGTAIAEQRIAAGLGFEEVSDATRLGIRFLSELERGKEDVSLQKALEAATALGLDVLVLPREEAARLRYYHRNLKS